MSDIKLVTPESLAKTFHERYEKFAPDFGYTTRVESSVPWEDVPKNNQYLMIAVCASILSDFQD